MTEKMNPDDEITFLQNKLQFIRSIQIPSHGDLSFLISLLADPDENEIICASVYPVLQRAGPEAVDALLAVYSALAESDEKTQIRFSYAFSQLSESPASVFETFLKSRLPRVRQNGVIGLALLNDRQFDPLLSDVLRTDDDAETAYEAAAALSGAGADVLPSFESVMADDLREKTYMDSPTKISADNADISYPAEARSSRSLDKHVLAKVIEIAGDIGNEGTLPYLTAYLRHPDERISRTASESIQKINSELNNRR